MEPEVSPYTEKKYESKKDKSNIQPSVPAGPSEYPQQNLYGTPSIPTLEYPDKNQKKIVDLQVYEQKGKF